MDPLLLKKQLQENASDLQDFCKDLKNWGEEMKRKEKALKNNGNEKSSLRHNDDNKNVTKAKSGAAQRKGVRRVHFENGTVKDEFNEVKDEDSGLNNNLTENKQDLALIEKEKGNKFIKSQKWEEAIKCYNKAIKYYADDPTFYANRALCYLKKGLYEDAERDCTSSLKLDCTYVKAYYRRATARESLNKLKQAEQDLVQIFEIEPKNEESKQLLHKLQQKLEKLDKGILPEDTVYEKGENAINSTPDSKPKASLKTPGTKLGTTDYAAWEKFDADAECEKLEDDINDDSELSDECNDSNQDLAMAEKEKGNKFVKNQKWDEAIVCYRKAIEYYSFDPIFYANRALCYIKKGSYEEAETDCTLSLKLNNTYVKAYQRRAAAREYLNKFEHAEYDLLKVLELEPKNTESIKSLEKLRQKLGKSNKVLEQRPVSKFTASRNKSNVSKTSTDSLNTQTIESAKVFDTSKPVPSWSEEENILLVKPIKKPPHMRSKKPLKRITILEKDGTEVNGKIMESEPEAIKQHVFEKRENIEPLKIVSTVKNDSSVIEETDNPIKRISAFRKKQMEQYSDKSISSDHSTAWPRSDQQSLLFKSEDFKVVEKAPPDLCADQNRIISKEVKNTSNISLSNENKKIELDKTIADHVKPKTSVQFTLTWKNLKDSEEKYKYFKLVDPQDLPKIFVNSLESHIFSDILEVLVQHFIDNKDPVYNILEYFTQVKRFDTLTMFLSVSDKRNLWKLFDYVKEVEEKNKEHVDRLIDKYEL